MKPFTKTIAGLVAGSMLSVSLAAPADAQRYRRHRDRGVDAGDVIAGVAIIGGIAAIAAALSNDSRRSGDRYQSGRYRDDYSIVVGNCGREAEQHERGNVRVTDVNRTGNDRYLVRGVIENGGVDSGGYSDRDDDRYYDRDGRYDDRDDRYYDRDRDDRYYDGGYRGPARLSFTCVARANGRITDFEVARY